MRKQAGLKRGTANACHQLIAWVVLLSICMTLGHTSVNVAFGS